MLNIFSNPEVAKLCTRFHIKQSFSSPYYPQGNGKVERMIYTIKDMLYAIIKEKRRSWSHVVWEVQLFGMLVYRSECQVTEFMKRFTEILRDLRLW